MLGPCLFLAYTNDLQTECWAPAYSWHTPTTCRQSAGPLPIPGKRQSHPLTDAFHGRHHLVPPHHLCRSSRSCSSTRPPQAGAVGKRLGDTLPPGKRQSTANHLVQEEQPATSRPHPPRSDPGDIALSQEGGRDTAVRPRMGNSHQQRLCQGEQDARLPQKKPESLLSQDQGACLQGTDPTHH